VAKFLSAAEIAAITETLEGKPGDVLGIVAIRPPPPARRSVRCGWSWARRFEWLRRRARLRWVIQFPMFTWRPEDSAGASTIRSPAPATPDGAPATAADLDDPARLLSRSYDLVLDGNEIGGGSIRTIVPTCSHASST